MKVRMILVVGNLIVEEQKRKRDAFEAAIKEKEEAEAEENSERKEKLRKLVREACNEMEEFEYSAREFLETEMN